MTELILDAVIDTVKTLPFLFIVYLAIEFISSKLSNIQTFLKKADKLGPVIGAATGCIPQCGFSVAASSLYSAGAIGAGTLAAVFISTSDEAVPILMSHSEFIPSMIFLIACKVVLGIISGYIISYTVFKNESTVSTVSTEPPEHSHCSCGHSHHSSVLLSSFIHTLQTALYLLISIMIINFAIFLIGEENLSAILLKGSLLQPALATLLGLIPGCSTSVLFTELFMSSNLSFGSTVAGLSAGAGFGFLVLFRELKDKKKFFKIILSVYAASAIGGTVIELISYVF